LTDSDGYFIISNSGEHHASNCQDIIACHSHLKTKSRINLIFDVEYQFNIHAVAHYGNFAVNKVDVVFHVAIQVSFHWTSFKSEPSNQEVAHGRVLILSVSSKMHII